MPDVKPESIVVWAVVTSDGDVVGAYTNRVSAARRCDFLDADDRMRRFSPYSMVRCVGEPTPKPRRTP